MAMRSMLKAVVLLHLQMCMQTSVHHNANAVEASLDLRGCLPTRSPSGGFNFTSLVCSASTPRALQLRGGGRSRRADVTKPDVLSKAIEKAQKRLKPFKLPFQPGLRTYVPFNGPFLYAIAGRSTKFELTIVQKFDVSTGHWSSAPPLDAPRAAFGVARARGRLYVIGGTSDFEPLCSVRSLSPYHEEGHMRGEAREDPAWEVESPLPFPRRFFAAASWQRDGHGTQAGGGGEEEVFVLGGAGRFDFKDDAAHDHSYASVLSYDARHRAWVNHTDMPFGRRHHAAAVCRGRIYVLGGWRSGLEGGNGKPDSDGLCIEVLAEVASYDPLSREWRAEAPMPTARRSLQAVCLNGRIYAIGGVYGGSQLATVESYDPEVRAWRREPDLIERRGGFGAAVFNGRIYVAGGIDGGNEIKTVEVFDPKTNTWAYDSPLPTCRWGLGLIPL
jgi:N-acetylneuraminic acid mutarotase